MRGAPPARTAEAVQQALGDAVDLILDAGPTPGGLPSTVVHAHDSLRIVREGGHRAKRDRGKASAARIFAQEFVNVVYSRQRCPYKGGIDANP